MCCFGGLVRWVRATKVRRRQDPDCSVRCGRCVSETSGLFVYNEVDFFAGLFLHRITRTRTSTSPPPSPKYWFRTTARRTFLVKGAFPSQNKISVKDITNCESERNSTERALRSWRLFLSSSCVLRCAYLCWRTSPPVHNNEQCFGDRPDRLFEPFKSVEDASRRSQRRCGRRVFCKHGAQARIAGTERGVRRQQRWPSSQRVCCP